MILFKFFVQICRFLWAKKQMIDSLKKTSDLLFYHERPEWIAHSRSLVMSNLSVLLTVTLLSSATWVIRSQSLICPERSEQISHSRSWKWAILSEWAYELIPSPGYHQES